MGKYRNAFFSEAIALIEPKTMSLHRQPSWISDRQKKKKKFRRPSNDYSWAVWFQLSQWFKRRSVLKHFQPIRAYYWPWQPC
jgi:hypothetical protein